MAKACCDRVDMAAAMMKACCTMHHYAAGSVAAGRVRRGRGRGSIVVRVRAEGSQGKGIQGRGAVRQRNDSIPAAAAATALAVATSPSVLPLPLTLSAATTTLLPIPAPLDVDPTPGASALSFDRFAGDMEGSAAQQQLQHMPHHHQQRRQRQWQQQQQQQPAQEGADEEHRSSSNGGVVGIKLRGKGRRKAKGSSLSEAWVSYLVSHLEGKKGGPTPSAVTMPRLRSGAEVGDEAQSQRSSGATVQHSSHLGSIPVVAAEADAAAAAAAAAGGAATASAAAAAAATTNVTPVGTHWADDAAAWAMLDWWAGRVTRAQLSNVMKELGRRGKVRAALSVFRWMEAQRDGVVGKERVDDAEEGHRRRLCPNAHVCTLMLGVLGRVREEEEESDSGRPGGEPSASMMLAEAKRIFTGLRAKGVIKDSVHVFNAMLAAYVRHGKYVEAWALFDEMMASEHRSAGDKSSSSSMGKSFRPQMSAAVRVDHASGHDGAGALVAGQECPASAEHGQPNGVNGVNGVNGDHILHSQLHSPVAEPVEAAASAAGAALRALRIAGEAGQGQDDASRSAAAAAAAAASTVFCAPCPGGGDESISRPGHAAEAPLHEKERAGKDEQVHRSRITNVQQSRQKQQHSVSIRQPVRWLYGLPPVGIDAAGHPFGHVNGHHHLPQTTECQDTADAAGITAIIDSQKHAAWSPATAAASLAPSPDVVTFNTMMMNPACLTSRPGHGHGAAAMAGKKTGPAVTAAAAADRAMWLYRELRKRGLQPTVRTFNALIAALGHGGRCDQAESMVAEMQKEGVAPDMFTYNLLISAYGRVQRLADAERAFAAAMAAGLRPTTVTFSSLVAAYAAAGRMSGALEAFRAMEHSGLRLDTKAFCGLMAVYKEAGMADEAERTFRRMIAAGVRPNTIAYSCLVHAYGREGRIEDAVRVFEEMMEAGGPSCAPDVQVFNILMAAYGQQGLSVPAARLYRRMLAHGLKPDVVTYNTLLQAFCVAGLPVQAGRTWSLMTAAGCQPDAVSRSLLYRAYNNAGWHGKVDALKAAAAAEAAARRAAGAAADAVAAPPSPGGGHALVAH